jgi:hypothetical protein
LCKAVPSFDSARKQPRKHGHLAIPLPRIVAKAPFTLTSTYFSGSTNLGVSLLDLLCGRQAVHNRHPHVHEDQIRPGTRAHRECLPSVGRLTNDLDVRLSESMYWRLSVVSSWSSTMARRVGPPTSSGEISGPTSLYTPDEQLAGYLHESEKQKVAPSQKIILLHSSRAETDGASHARESEAVPCNPSASCKSRNSLHKPRFRPATWW